MEPPDSLLTLAELGLALGGFGAIVLVVGRMAEDGRAISRVNVQSMIVNAVGAAWGTTVPFGLTALSLEGPVLWQVASGVWMFPTFLVGWPSGAAVVRQASRAGKLHRTHAIGFLSAAGLSTAIHVLNLTGLVFTPCYEAFLLGMWIVFGLATFQFLVLIRILLR